jgi:hypothetical protein
LFVHTPSESWIDRPAFCTATTTVGPSKLDRAWSYVHASFLPFGRELRIYPRAGGPATRVWKPVVIPILYTKKDRAAALKVIREHWLKAIGGTTETPKDVENGVLHPAEGRIGE